LGRVQGRDPSLGGHEVGPDSDFMLDVRRASAVEQEGPSRGLDRFLSALQL
jgi:hypothetical protein